MAQVVEDEQHVGDHQRHVGQAERVGVGLAERLDCADQVIAEEADRAAGERRQVLDRREPEAARCSATAAYGSGASAASRRRPASRSRDPVAPAQHRAGAEADEGVAADLALLRRLEQEAGRPLGLARAKLEEGRDRRLAIVDETGADRHHVAARRARGPARDSARASARSQRRRPLSTSITRPAGPRVRRAARSGGRAGRPPLRRRARRTPRARPARPPRPPPRPSRRSASGRRAAHRVAALGPLGGAAAQGALQRGQRLVGDRRGSPAAARPCGLADHSSR